MKTFTNVFVFIKNKLFILLCSSIILSFVVIPSFASLQDAISNGQTSYTFRDNETATGNLGSLKANLTITGNNKILSGNNHKGIEIKSNQTLVVDNLTIQGFLDSNYWEAGSVFAAVGNTHNARLTIKNSKITNNKISSGSSSDINAPIYFGEFTGAPGGQYNHIYIENVEFYGNFNNWNEQNKTGNPIDILINGAGYLHLSKTVIADGGFNYRGGGSSSGISIDNDANIYLLQNSIVSTHYARISNFAKISFNNFSGVFDTNKNIQTYSNIDKFESNNGTLILDVQLNGNNTTGDSFSISGNPTGTLNVTVSTLSLSGESGSYNFLNKSGLTSVTVTNPMIKMNGLRYVFDATTTTLSYELRTDLKTALNSKNIYSYELREDEMCTDNAGLGSYGSGKKTFSVTSSQGNSFNVNGGGYSGIIISNGQTLTVNASTWTNFKKAGDNGSVIYNNSGGTVNIGNGVVFVSNSITSVKDKSGGAIYNAGTMTIGDNVIFKDNKAGTKTDSQVSHAGAIYNAGTITYGNNITFENNHADFIGGAVYGGTSIFTGTVYFINNNSKDGAAIQAGNNTFNGDVQFKNNWATRRGGAINGGYNTFNAAVLFDNNSTRANNGWGGGAINLRTNTWQIFNGNVTFSNNSSDCGGAICSEEGSSLTFNNSQVTFTNNKQQGTTNDIVNGEHLDGSGSAASTISFNNSTVNMDGGIIAGDAKIQKIVNINKTTFNLNTGAIITSGNTVNVTASVLTINSGQTKDSPINNTAIQTTHNFLQDTTKSVVTVSGFETGILLSNITDATYASAITVSNNNLGISNTETKTVKNLNIIADNNYYGIKSESNNVLTVQNSTLTLTNNSYGALYSKNADKIVIETSSATVADSQTMKEEELEYFKIIQNTKVTNSQMTIQKNWTFNDWQTFKADATQVVTNLNCNTGNHLVLSGFYEGLNLNNISNSNLSNFNAGVSKITATNNNYGIANTGNATLQNKVIIASNNKVAGIYNTGSNLTIQKDNVTLYAKGEDKEGNGTVINAIYGIFSNGSGSTELTIKQSTITTNILGGDLKANSDGFSGSASAGDAYLAKASTGTLNIKENKINFVTIKGGSISSISSYAFLYNDSSYNTINAGKAELFGLSSGNIAITDSTIDEIIAYGGSIYANSVGGNISGIAMYGYNAMYNVIQSGKAGLVSVNSGNINITNDVINRVTIYGGSINTTGTGRGITFHYNNNINNTVSGGEAYFIKVSTGKININDGKMTDIMMIGGNLIAKEISVQQPNVIKAGDAYGFAVDSGTLSITGSTINMQVMAGSSTAGGINGMAYGMYLGKNSTGTIQNSNVTFTASIASGGVANTGNSYGIYIAERGTLSITNSTVTATGFGNKYNMKLDDSYGIYNLGSITVGSKLTNEQVWLWINWNNTDTSFDNNPNGTFGWDYGISHIYGNESNVNIKFIGKNIWINGERLDMGNGYGIENSIVTYSVTGSSIVANLDKKSRINITTTVATAIETSSNSKGGIYNSSILADNAGRTVPKIIANWNGYNINNFDDAGTGAGITFKGNNTIKASYIEAKYNRTHGILVEGTNNVLESETTIEVSYNNRYGIAIENNGSIVINGLVKASSNTGTGVRLLNSKLETAQNGELNIIANYNKFGVMILDGSTATITSIVAKGNTYHGVGIGRSQEIEDYGHSNITVGTIEVIGNNTGLVVDSSTLTVEKIKAKGNLGTSDIYYPGEQIHLHKYGEIIAKEIEVENTGLPDLKGIALYDQSKITVNSSTIKGNEYGIYCYSGNIKITTSSSYQTAYLNVESNQSSGILLQNNSVMTIVKADVFFKDNTIGAEIDSGNLQVTYSTLTIKNTETGLAGIKVKNNGTVNISNSDVYVSGVSNVGIDGTGGTVEINDSYVTLSGNTIGAKNINKRGYYSLILSSNTTGLWVTEQDKVINNGVVTIAGNTVGIQTDETGSLTISNLSMDISKNKYGIKGSVDSNGNKTLEIKNVASLTLSGNTVGIENAKLRNVGSASMLVENHYNSTGYGLSNVDISESYGTFNNNKYAIINSTITGSYFGFNKNTYAIKNTNISESEISIYEGKGNGSFGLSYEGNEYYIENTNMSIKKTTFAVAMTNTKLSMVGLCSGSQLELEGNLHGIGITSGQNKLTMDKMNISISSSSLIEISENLEYASAEIEVKYGQISMCEGYDKELIRVGRKSKESSISFRNVTVLSKDETDRRNYKFLTSVSDNDIQVNMVQSKILGSIVQSGTGKIDLSLRQSNWQNVGNSVINSLEAYSTSNVIEIRADRNGVDKLTVKESFNGTLMLNVKDLDEKYSYSNYYRVVDLETAQIESGSGIYGGNTDLGAYTYNLSSGTSYGGSNGKSYYLVKGGINNAAKTVENTPAILNSVVSAGLNSLNRRLGDIRRTPQENLNGVWARVYGRNDKFDKDIETKTEMTGAEGGYDRQIMKDKKDRYYIGAMVGYQNINKIETKQSKNAFNNGSGEGKAPSVGVYGTWIAENGLFVDVTIRNFWISLDMTSYVNDKAEKYKPYRNQIAASVEFGKEFKVETGTNSKVIIEPKTEWVYSYGRGTGCNIGNNRIEYSDTRSIRGKIGVMIGFNKKTEKGLAFEPYIEAGYNYEFDNKTEISYAGASLTRDLSGGYGDIGVGFNTYLGKGINCYSLLSYEKGSEQENIFYNIGIRYGF